MNATPLPLMPGDISLFVEDGRIIFRVGESNSLYVYDRDIQGVPTCVGDCERTWLPVLATVGSTSVGDWSLVKRAAGGQQWRYKSRPLYTYMADRPGETKGDGVDGVWHLVSP